ncbi:MAG: SH3 domain-containing protein [Clostridia bacterium]|nr:SH3 domain-containing protein [Clostridia bacterium]
MSYRAMKRLFCAALAALLLVLPALAENPSDDVTGYNPFTGIDDSPQVEAPAPILNNAFTGDATQGDPFAADTATASDPFGVGTTTTDTSNPFGLAADTGTTDPFGVGAAATTDDALNGAAAVPAATVAPSNAIGGYNPFTDAQSEPAVAVAPGTVMFVEDDTLRLRAKAAENSKVVGTVFYGQQLTVSATQGDWAQVVNANNVTCYCELNSLTVVDPNTMSKLMYAQLATTPVYKAPSQKMGRLKNLKRGDTVTLVAITADGLWSRVTNDNLTFGYVPTIYLDDTPAAEGTPVWCMSGSTAVMVNPDNWIQITTLSFGQSCWLVGYTSNNAVAKIRSAKGYVAYCDASALTTADPANMSTPVYVQATGKILCSSTGENANVYNVNKNVQLMLLGVDSSQYWALVRQGKRKVYVPYVYIDTDRAGNELRVVAATQDAPLYSANNTGSSVLGTLPLGTRVNLIGGDSRFAQVATIADGVSAAVTGYVPLQYLRGE